MSKIDKLKYACDCLSKIGEHENVQCIAVLNWDKLPEATSRVNTIVYMGHRVTHYKMNSVSIVEIDDVGFFQII